MIVLYTEEYGLLEVSNQQWEQIIDRTAAVWWKFHRTDGPAVMFESNHSFWLAGEKYTEKDYNKLIQEVKDMPLVLRLVDPRKWVREFI